jgi:hypothetical protein
MAAMLNQLPRETCVIQPADHDLLHAALRDWYDMTAFTDEHVAQVKRAPRGAPRGLTRRSAAQVKALCKRIFQLPDDTNLVGSVLPDAVILQPAGNNHTFYALVQDEDNGGGWECMELTCQGTFSWMKDTPFRLVLFFLSQSAGGMTVVTRPNAG